MVYSLPAEYVEVGGVIEVMSLIIPSDVLHYVSGDHLETRREFVVSVITLKGPQLSALAGRVIRSGLSVQRIWKSLEIIDFVTMK